MFISLVQKMKDFEDEMKELGYGEIAKAMRVVKRTLVRSAIEAEITKAIKEIEKEV